MVSSSMSTENLCVSRRFLSAGCANHPRIPRVHMLLLPLLHMICDTNIAGTDPWQARAFLQTRLLWIASQHSLRLTRQLRKSMFSLLNEYPEFGGSACDCTPSQRD